MNCRLKNTISKSICLFIIYSSFLFLFSCNKAINYNEAQNPVYKGDYSDGITNSGTLKVVTFNTSFSNDIDKIIQLIQESDRLKDTDVLFLQEVDNQSSLTVAKRLKYNYSYVPSAVHPKTNKDFGNAILTKWKIVESEKMILPEKGNFRGLRRSAIKSVIKVNETDIHVYNVHLSTQFELPPEKRYRQAEFIFNDASNSGIPTIIAGDFNDNNIARLALNYGFDWPTKDVDNTISMLSWDHILTKNLELASPEMVGVLSYNVSVTEHRPVWAKFDLDNEQVKEIEELDVTYEEPVVSLGQPVRFKPYFGMSMVLDRRDNDTDFGGLAYFGLYKDLANPVAGLLGIAAETYIGGSSKSELVGFRLLASSPVLHIHAGLDYEIVENEHDLILSLTPPLKRGGLLGQGDFLRIDWIPTRSHTFLFGFQIPLFQRTGKTRPKDRKVTLPKPVEKSLQDENIFEDPKIAEKLAIMRQTAKWMISYNLFYEDTSVSFDKSIRSTNELIDEAVELIKSRDEVYPDGKTFNALSEVYHQQLDSIFRENLTIGEVNSDKLITAVRMILLEDIIIPYDRTIGQVKRYDSVLGYGENARKNLDKWIENNLTIDEKNKIKALDLFDQVVLVLEDTREHVLNRWRGDNRRVWLLYQYALLPHEHDSREEVDNLIENSVGEKFTEGNAVVALNSIDFIRQLRRTIKETRDYHVLWVHDYRGVDSFGKPDQISFEVSINSYMDALTQSVKEYDETGEIPVFMIFIDQFFYEIQKGRMWLTLLENPLEHKMKLPDEFADMQRSVDGSQERLREAVKNSKRLTAEAAEFGDQYIKDKVKVHVFVTQPPDFSFLSPGLVKGFPILPDNVMIDHRKIVFYDLTEGDPYKGEAIFTGTGIGEHYSTPTWDDRALLVSGPAAVELTEMARSLLVKNGMSESEIPEVLKVNYEPGNSLSEERSQSQAAGARAMTVENSIGYGNKYSTLMFSILYSLVPPNTTIALPDSLWLGEYWAGMVIGAAMRGCHVYVIAPSAQNAPSPGSVQMWRSKVVLSKLVSIHIRAVEILEINSGILRIGVYNRKADVGNVSGVLNETVDRYRKYDFLREEFPVDDRTLGIFLEIADELEAQGYEPTTLAEDKKDRLVNIHRKTRFFVSQEILLKIVEILNTERDLKRSLGIYVRASLEENPGDAFNNEVLQVVYPIIKDYKILKNKGSFTSDILYYGVGSQNHDPRGMMLDGEVSYLISGPWALWGYVDALYTFGMVDWIETQEELEEYLPIQGERMRSIGYWIRNLL